MTDRWTPSRLASDLPPPPELHGRIRAAIAATPAPRIGVRLRIAAALAVVPCAAAALLVLATHLVDGRSIVRAGLRDDVAMEGASHVFIVLVLLVGLTLATTLVAVTRGRRGLGPGVVSLVGLSVLVAPLYAALAFGGSGRGEPTRPELSPWGIPCLYIATAVGLFVLATFAAALRRSVPVASRQRGTALGAAAGAWAGLTVFVFCPAGAYPHLLIGHVLPVVAFTLLGLAAVPRALRV